MLDDRPTVPNLEMTFTPDTMSVRRARHAVTKLFAGYSARTRETIALLTSELASNAVLHGGTAFTLRASAEGSTIRVAVSDRGGRRPSMRTPDRSGNGGWGLSMVDAAATCWGVDGGTECTTVWFEIDSRDPR